MADWTNYFAAAPAAVGGNPTQMPYGPAGTVAPMQAHVGGGVFSPTVIGFLGLLGLTLILFHVGE